MHWRKMNEGDLYLHSFFYQSTLKRRLHENPTLIIIVDLTEYANQMQEIINEYKCSIKCSVQNNSL